MSLTISVVGTGYLGAVHAVCMADLGHTVIAIDTDADKIASLARGHAPIYEPGLDELLARVLAAGHLTFTTDVSAVADADVHFLCVGTPQRSDGYEADTTYVYAAAEAIAPHLKQGALVVGKSTVPVGTASSVLETLRAGAPARVDARLAWNPEFLREGFAIEDTVAPDRFVYGVEGEHAEADIALLDHVYEEPLSHGTPRLVTDYPTAELVKVAANAYLATKISFINAMSEICEAAGADVLRLADAIGHDDRIGRKFLGAGIGFGGGCLPKDIRAFMARAEELDRGESVAFLREVDAINLRRRQRVVELAREVCGGAFTGRTVTVLGAAFKPNSDDIRDSPALDVAEAVLAEGATVRVHDPKALDIARRLHPGPAYVDSVEEAVAGTDVVLHLTEWQEYRALDTAALASKANQAVVVDGRNVLDARSWRESGWVVHALGRARA